MGAGNLFGPNPRNEKDDAYWRCLEEDMINSQRSQIERERSYQRLPNTCGPYETYPYTRSPSLEEQRRNRLLREELEDNLKRKEKEEKQERKREEEFQQKAKALLPFLKKNLHFGKVEIGLLSDRNVGDHRITDWALSNGAIGGKYLYYERGPYGFEYIGITDGDLYGKVNPCARGYIATPVFYNAEKYGISRKRISIPDYEMFALQIHERTVYQPNTKISGNVEVLRPLEMYFHTDKNRKENQPCELIANQCYEVIVDGKKGVACKLKKAIKNKNIIYKYDDDTPVVDGKPVWHWVEPIEVTTFDEHIVCRSGLPHQFELESEPGEMKRRYQTLQQLQERGIIKKLPEHSLDMWQIGRTLRVMYDDMERSAIFMERYLYQNKPNKATTVKGLFARLHAKHITEDEVRRDLKQLVVDFEEKKGSLKDAILFERSITDAIKLYKHRKTSATKVLKSIKSEIAKF